MNWVTFAAQKLKMKKYLLNSLFIGFAFVCKAQDTIILKGNDFTLGEEKIAELKKKKKGLLSTPKFILENKSEKQLIIIEPVMPATTGPETLPSTWYVFNCIEPKDSFLVSKDELAFYEKAKFFGAPTDALAKVINENHILKADGTIDSKAFETAKVKHPNFYGQIDANNRIKNAECLTALAILIKRDITKSVEITETARNFNEEKKYAEITYEIKQDNAVIGKMIAKGNLVGAKKDDSEYDYSAGIMDLDFKSAPLDYYFYNTTGCRVATLYTQDASFYTVKDAVTVKRGVVTKGGSSYNSRLTFIKTISEYLVKKGYY